jgi:large subunit ribosomal protein L17
VAKLFTDIALRMKERPGGYTRIIKLGERYGDAAEVVILELVDYKLNADEASNKKAKKDAKKADKKEARKNKNEQKAKKEEKK